MNQAVKLGFHSFTNLKSFAVIPRNFKRFSLVSPTTETMGSKRLLSSSTSEAKEIVLKETVVRGKMVESEILVDDQDSVERMTVQQLRLKLRSVGVPAKGSKRDLIHAMKSFLNNKNNDADDGSLIVEDQLSSKAAQICTKSSSKRKGKGSSIEGHVQNINIASEVHGLKRTKRKVKQGPVEDEYVELHATKQELSIETNEITVLSSKKSTPAKRKIQSEIAFGDLGSSGMFDSLENQNEPWTILAHKKPQKGWIPYNPKTMRPPPLTGDRNHVKLMSWNVNGLRALLKVKAFSALQLAQREDFDVLCLQETKLQEKDVEAIKDTLLEGYENSFWTCSVSKLGYSGTAIISRIKPLSVRYGLGISDHDSEGRLVTIELNNFYLLSGYIPNSGDGLKRLVIDS
ncbi:unnamed protein product [Ilex paraguariensis]|uniref:DNA-(apurinic or apyrimidinic site) endonuclease n=1 Tax=Ilex paraguariensis TaxID=185542 RepID=A0ABC8UXV0_9AQUA